MSESLHIQDLSVMRGDSLLIDGLSFSLAPGEMIWLAGDNGSGKTSLLRCLAGFLPPFSGDIIFGDQARRDQAGGDQAWQRNRDDLPLIWHGHRRGLAPSLTGREALQDTARLFGGDLPDFEDPASDAFDIHSFIDLPIRVLSFGQSQRLALSRLLIRQDGPVPLWLLDEPNSGLDGHSRAALNAVMRAHLAAGGRIVIASHLPLDGFDGQQAVRKLDLSAEGRG
ncbi:MAG: heme ABC exporter ATP-binding protein CcmA [Candidatus Puniceispirillaceae bacterium]